MPLVRFYSFTPCALFPSSRSTQGHSDTESGTESDTKSDTDTIIETKHNNQSNNHLFPCSVALAARKHPNLFHDLMSYNRTLLVHPHLTHHDPVRELIYIMLCPLLRNCHVTLTSLYLSLSLLHFARTQHCCPHVLRRDVGRIPE